MFWHVKFLTWWREEYSGTNMNTQKIHLPGIRNFVTDQAR